MTFDLPVVSVHSIAEAYLYLMTMRCSVCGQGPLKESGELTKTSDATDGWTLSAACAACRRPCTVRFTIDPPPTREQARSSQINPTSESSRAIDLLGWLTLFQSIIAASEKEKDRKAARQLALEAGLCLDEAMKFYEADNEMPGEGAFFTDESQRRYREHPQHFSRCQWRQRRLMLPDAAIRTKPEAGRARWWQFWRADW